MGDKRKKAFNVHDLYPKDYCFNFEAFEADPESYVFTEDDIAYMNAMELERYEQKVPMSSYEKKLLRKWVMSGHSPYENPGSKYLFTLDTSSWDFLDVYRMDRDIRRDMKGMSKAEQTAYLKEEMGCPDDPENNDPYKELYPETDLPFDTD